MATQEDWSLYPYDPNKAAPIAFAILVTALGVALFYQSFFKYHWTHFGFMMTWASTVWVSGFICRSISVREVQNIPMFIAQYVLVLVGPPLYAASEYFILGRLFAYLPYHTPMHPGRVLSTFLLLSAIVESLSANGAARLAQSDPGSSEYEVGLDLLRAGLILQSFIEAFFFSLVALLEYRCRRAKSFPRSVRIVCYILYTTSLMMLLRCIIRVIEGFESGSCSSGYCGPVSRDEWFLWVFEAANITLFVLLLCIFHPGRYLPRSHKIFLDPTDSKTERLGPGFSEANKRPLLLSIVDAYNLQAIFGGRGMVVNKFWEDDWPVYNGQPIPREKTFNWGRKSSNQVESEGTESTA